MREREREGGNHRSDRIMSGKKIDGKMFILKINICEICEFDVAERKINVEKGNRKQKVHCMYGSVYAAVMDSLYKWKCALHSVIQFG